MKKGKNREQKIGIFGGTFNPIHTGHLIMASEVRNILGLERVIFVPANIPPHKEPAYDIPAMERLNMVRMAIKGKSFFDVSDFEIKSGGKSFTIKTLNYFINRFGKGTQLYLIIGDELVKELDTWQDYKNILSLVNLVVLRRKGIRRFPEFIRRKSVIFLKNSLIEITSTDIRQRIRNNLPIDFLVPYRVQNYIKRKGYYRK